MCRSFDAWFNAHLSDACILGRSSINQLHNKLLNNYIHIIHTHTHSDNTTKNIGNCTHPSLPEIHNCTLLREGDFN